MSQDPTYRNPLVRDGQSQSGRIIPALSPDYVRIDERDEADLMAFASQFSKLIQYYNEQNEADGHWGDFFKEGTSPEAPHYALYLAFIRLFGHLQEDLNTITSRHLNHYYKEILQLEHKPAQADSVHLLVELAKNIDQHLLKKGTLVKAGKDAMGKDLYYAIDKDIVLNKARVTELKTIFQESFFDTNGKLRKVDAHGIYAAPIANSSDGLGTDEQADLTWKLLGASQLDAENRLPNASLGFAISSPILLLREGKRKITIDVELQENLHKELLPYFMAVIVGSNDFNKTEIQGLQQLLSNLSLPNSLSDEQIGLLKLTGKVLERHLTQELEALPPAAHSNPGPDDQLTEQKRIWWQGLKDTLKVNNPDTGLPDFDPKAAFDVLKFLMDHHAPQALKKAFVISLSGEEGWIGPFVTDARYQHGRRFLLDLELSVEDPAIAAYDEKVLEGGFGDGHPLLKVMLNEHENYQYSILRNLRPTKFKIRVEAEGIKNLVLQNDTANLNPNKIFQPFGPQPTFDNRFYIGSEEVLQKPLSQLTLNIEWADQPEDLGKHYAVYSEELSAKVKYEIDELESDILTQLTEIQVEKNLEFNGRGTGYDFDKAEAELQVKREKLETSRADYDSLQIKTETFTGSFDLLESGSWKQLINRAGSEEVMLFGEESRRTVELKPLNGAFNRPDQIREIKELDKSTLNGFIRLSLTGPKLSNFSAFGHQNFQRLYTKRMIEQLKPKNQNETIRLPEEPYTPAISSISLDYKADLTIDFNLGKEHHEKLYHIHPFGLSEVGKKETAATEKTLLPSYTTEGALYIGLEEAKPSQNISILFQLNEKSVDHEFVGKVNITWSYLHNNLWKDFEDTQILSDSTEVFTRSGIVTFQLPKEITSDNSLLPSGKFWIRAAATDNTSGIADAQSIQAQAVTATFVDHQNDVNHLATPLAAKAIKKLKVSDSAIKSLTQAYPSFNGKLKEQDTTFYTRVSERLRHKRRGITIWDYEHIVLEAFPKVYKVKCLNHYNPEQSACRKQMSPGAVTLIVLSRAEDETDISRKLAPVTNVITLNAIKEHLHKIIPPFIAARNKLFVKNPTHTPIKIDCAVKFNTGYDQSYYTRELNNALLQFFSPWAFDKTQDISFDRKIYKSIIVNFIEELPYINFISCFKVYRIDQQGAAQEIKEDIIEAADPADILISHDQHRFYIIEGDTCDCEEIRNKVPQSEVIVSGIGAMIIESDFRVA